MTSGNRCCIEIRRHQTKDTGQRARQIMDAVSDNYATTRRDRYIRLTQKSNTKCFFFADHVWHVNKALKSAMSGANYVDGVSIMTDWQPLVKRNWLGFETCQNNSASKFTYGVNYVNDIVMAIANERYQFNSLYSMQPRCAKKSKRKDVSSTQSLVSCFTLVLKYDLSLKTPTSTSVLDAMKNRILT